MQVKNPSEQLHVGIIGGGLGGLITAMDLAEAGHKVGGSIGHTHSNPFPLFCLYEIIMSGTLKDA